MSVAPPAPLNRLDVLRGLRISIAEGVWATVFTILTTGAFQIGFALFLGASPLVLGILAGIPSVVGLLQIPASLYSERQPARKGFVGAFAVASRLLWLPILLIPFLFPHSVGLWIFVCLLLLSSVFATIVVPAWTSWMSDLVPPNSRGQYFAQRNTIAGIVTLLAPLPAGAFLDQAAKYHRFDERIAYAVLFGLATVAAVVSFTLLRRQPEPPRLVKSDIASVNPLTLIAAPLSDSAFRRFLTYAAVLTIGQQFAGQFFTSWQVDKAALNLPYLTVQILGAVASAAALASTPVWGFLNDKYGSRPVLVVSVAGVIVAPALWMLTIADPNVFWWNVGVIVVLNLCAGAFWAGVGLTQFNLLLAAAPDNARSTYVAVFSAITGIVGGIAPILGGITMTLLANLSIPLGFGLVLNNYKILFAATILIRIVCLYLLGRVPRAEGTSTRYLIKQLLQPRPLTSFVAARRLAQPASEPVRLQTVDTLGDLRTPLAVEELAAALDDVSHSVRENAAIALGKIGDPRAIEALSAKLFDPAAGIGEASAAALGQIGDRSATFALMRAVQEPDATVRVAALKALAKISDPNALPALIVVLDARHPTACEAACATVAAIANLLNPVASVEIAQHLLPLLDTNLPRGIRLAAARALEPILGKGGSMTFAVAPILNALQSENDNSVAAQLTAVLCRMGNALNLPTDTLLTRIFDVLNRDSLEGIAYKQTVNSLADIVLPVGEFYPYLGIPVGNLDERINRLLTDLRRHHPNSDAIAIAQTALGSGDYAAMIEALAAQTDLFYIKSAAETAARLARRGDLMGGKPYEALLAILLAAKP